MSWHIFSRSFAPAAGEFRLTAQHGGKLAWIWELRMKSAVTIFRFQFGRITRASFILVPIARRSFGGSAAFAAFWRVSPAAANIAWENSIRDFGYDSGIPVRPDRLNGYYFSQFSRVPSR